MCWTAAAWLGLTGAGSVASASAPQLPGLNWVRLAGAESCVATATVVVDGHVRRSEGDRWDVTLEVSNPTGGVLGRRELHFRGAHCTVIEESVILVIAVTLDPEAGVVKSDEQLDRGTSAQLDSIFGEEPTEPEPPSAVTPRIGSAVASESRATQRNAGAAPSLERPSAQRPHATSAGVPALDISGVGDLRQMPGLGLGLALHLLLRAPWVGPLEVGVMSSLSQNQIVEHAAQPSVSEALHGQTQFQVLAASLAACPLSAGERAAFSLCAGAALGRLRSNPHFEGLVNKPASSDVVFQLFGAGVLRVRLWNGLFVRTSIEVGVPLPRWRYVTQVGGLDQEAFRMSPVDLRLLAGVGWRL
jgi:hypothetical protein